MSGKLFDDPEEDWANTKAPDIWGEDSDEEESHSGRSLKLKLKLNPKILAFGVIAIISIALVSNFLSKTPEGENVKVESTPTPSQSSQASAAKPVDLYSQPASLQSFIDNALASAVTIFCGEYSGSGWVVDLSDDPNTSKDDSYPTEIVTNHHVIETCGVGSMVQMKLVGEQVSFNGYIYSEDSIYDLAVIITDKPLPAFATLTSENVPARGQWVMAVGSPGASGEGSVTTGHISNIQDSWIITDTTLNPGNSGGPLINSAGQVIAINTAKNIQQAVSNVNYSRKLEYLCGQLNGCSRKQIQK